MRIVVRDRGSLRVEASPGETIEIVDGEGRPFGLGGRTAVTLCRCGQSESKPFCDSSHNRCGFDSVVVARDLPPPVPK
jgi:CDGSH-type Zn-finger protein